MRYKPQYALGAIWRPLGTVVDTFHRLVYASLPQHIQCVFCVFFPSILDIKFVGRTSRGHTGGSHTGFIIHLLSAVRALIFLAKRIQPFLSLVDREVEQCLCVCVFFPFILDIKFVGRTSRGHTGGSSHSISHPPSFCGACLHLRQLNITRYITINITITNNRSIFITVQYLISVRHGQDR